MAGSQTGQQLPQQVTCWGSACYHGLLALQCVWTRGVLPIVCYDTIFVMDGAVLPTAAAWFAGLCPRLSTLRSWGSRAEHYTVLRLFKCALHRSPAALPATDYVQAPGQPLPVHGT